MPTSRALSPPDSPPRIDTVRLKQRHAIADVARWYGLDLRPVGGVWMAVCPFHDDHQPSLLLDPEDDHFHCFSGRCDAHGDVIDLVRRLEGVGFLEAVARLGDTPPRPRSSQRARRRLGLQGAPGAAASVCRPREDTPRRRRGAPAAGPAERACLAAAVELYANCLLADRAALAYVEGRGLRRATIERCRVGYARGAELVPHLRWRGLPLPAARRAGLLRADGADVLAGRIVVPELRGGQPLWLVGRALEGPPGAPKYLGLAGEKPLLGREWAAAARWPLGRTCVPTSATAGNPHWTRVSQSKGPSTTSTPGGAVRPRGHRAAAAHSRPRRGFSPASPRYFGAPGGPSRTRPTSQTGRPPRSSGTTTRPASTSAPSPRSRPARRAAGSGSPRHRR